MQATEMRFVRQQILKQQILAPAVTPVPYGELVFRAPRGTFLYVERAVVTGFNIAGGRSVYLSDGSAQTYDAITPAQALTAGIAGLGVPAAFDQMGASIRGVLVSSGELFLSSYNIITGEIVALRAQLALYVPDAHDVAPSSFTEDEAGEEAEEVYINA